MLTTERIVRRWKHRRDFGGDFQELVEITRLGGLPVRIRVIDTERIPAWAMIELGCFGETSWRSKFKEYI